MFALTLPTIDRVFVPKVLGISKCAVGAAYAGVNTSLIFKTKLDGRSFAANFCWSSNSRGADAQRTSSSIVLARVE